MPIYEFECEQCGFRHEFYTTKTKFNDVTTCVKLSCYGRMVRVPSVPAPVQRGIFEDKDDT